MKYPSDDDTTIDLSSEQVQLEMKEDELLMEEMKSTSIDQAELDKELAILKEEDPEKYELVNEAIQNENTTHATAGKMGTVGDILISYDSSTLWWNHGHAAIVRYNNDYIVEAWPKKGVRVYANNWKNRWNSKKKMYVKGASFAKYKAADAYAKSRVGQSYVIDAGKKYLYGYYCSQLVWQAWWKQGYDLDSNGGLIVTPAQLEKDSQTIVY